MVRLGLFSLFFSKHPPFGSSLLPVRCQNYNFGPMASFPFFFMAAPFDKSSESFLSHPRRHVFGPRHLSSAPNQPLDGTFISPLALRDVFIPPPGPLFVGDVHYFTTTKQAIYVDQFLPFFQGSHRSREELALCHQISEKYRFPRFHSSFLWSESSEASGVLAPHSRSPSFLFYPGPALGISFGIPAPKAFLTLWTSVQFSHWSPFFFPLVPTPSGSPFSAKLPPQLFCPPTTSDISIDRRTIGPGDVQPLVPPHKDGFPSSSSCLRFRLLSFLKLSIL